MIPKLVFYPIVKDLAPFYPTVIMVGPVFYPIVKVLAVYLGPIHILRKRPGQEGLGPGT
jgi:hypothetical protein